MCRVARLGSYSVPRLRDVAYEDFERNMRRPIQLRVFNFLKQWIEKQGTERLEGHKVDEFARTTLALDDPKLAKQLLGTISKLVRVRARRNRLRSRDTRSDPL